MRSTIYWWSGWPHSVCLCGQLQHHGIHHVSAVPQLNDQECGHSKPETSWGQDCGSSGYLWDLCQFLRFWSRWRQKEEEPAVSLARNNHVNILSPNCLYRKKYVCFFCPTQFFWCFLHSMLLWGMAALGGHHATLAFKGHITSSTCPSGLSVLWHLRGVYLGNVTFGFLRLLDGIHLFSLCGIDFVCFYLGFEVGSRI